MKLNNEAGIQCSKLEEILTHIFTNVSILVSLNEWTDTRIDSSIADNQEWNKSMIYTVN